ncbi:MAG: hypothetical protein COV67_01120 [Nitrospinae bacterium CG11_big_fil_rev_8_21_14_0_20_56_8]|nr:MAG: hypothetical protein COV67_01120 [Nitrospinae bacterium CG11_big_fil_rev_8_21_14_0_20_56_8]
MLRALDGVSFDLSPGAFLTIFGANGAGKTTLLNILSGLTRPTSGTAIVAGHDATRGDPHLMKKIGVISHASCLYADLSPLENLVFYARMYGLEDPEDTAVKAIERVGLKARIHDRVRTFSRGMLQRLSIARATLHDPEVLFLDEPFTGLDPRASSQLKEYLRALHTGHRTILMTTHDISCGLEMSDRVAVQVKGRFAFLEHIDNVEKNGFEKMYLEMMG